MIGAAVMRCVWGRYLCGKQLSITYHFEIHLKPSIQSDPGSVFFRRGCQFGFGAVFAQIGFGAVFAQNPGFGAVLTGGDGGRSGGRRNDASRLRMIFYGDSNRF